MDTDLHVFWSGSMIVDGDFFRFRPKSVVKEIELEQRAERRAGAP